MGSRKRLRKAQARAIELENAARREREAEGKPWYLQPTLRAMLKNRANRDSDIAPEDNQES